MCFDSITHDKTDIGQIESKNYRFSKNSSGASSRAFHDFSL